MLVLAVLVVAVITALVVARRPSSAPATPLRQAIDVTDQPALFATTTSASGAFAEIADLLLAETQRCGQRSSQPAPSCVALGQAAALTESASTLARHCGPDDLNRMRTSVRTFLVAIDRPISDLRDLPASPALPTCT